MNSAFQDFSIGALVWIKSPLTEWKEAEIVGLTGETVEVEDLETGQYIKLKRESQEYKTMHESSKSGVDDMTTLAELNEGSLLRNLRIRFAKNTIYTFTGTILVSLNPYKQISIYTQETIRQYKGEAIGALPPHIFSIADEAFHLLLEDSRNKSILISGESGAGKTESTKLILQYLTHLSGSHSPVEQLLLESSPILEAFGNAKTSINDNSSRFGKYMEVFINSKGTIIGGQITQYLLEKSRIVMQSTGDRNYHIFYTLLAGLPAQEKERLQLKGPSHYRYLQNGDQAKIEQIDSPKALQDLTSALLIVGFGSEVQATIFQVVSAILHLGNITFQSKPDDSSEIINRDELEIAAKLLAVLPQSLKQTLTSLSVKTGRDLIQKSIPVPKAEATRDTIAKALYGRLFSWIVSSINDAMKVKKNIESFIEESSVGVLDIFGFETVQHNSFEQFCINMANETLQTFFNNRIFQMEQEDYEREGISWQKIAFVDNSTCLKVLYKAKLSLLNLLDEESNFPSATDDTLVAKFHENHSDAECYEKPHGSAKEFTIVHYAGKVTYKTPGFLEKNSDSLNDGIIALFRECGVPMISTWFDKDQDLLQMRGTIKRGYKPPTVGAQFKESLSALMNRLEATDPYFIRCIKPNADKEPDNFNSELVLKQLRNTGMLETIRIRRLGYPLRLTFEDFLERYFMLKPDIQRNAGELKDQCLLIVNYMRVDVEDFQLGKTTIFLRNPAQKILDDRRHAIMVQASIRLSSFAKAMLTRKMFLKKRQAIVLLQKVFRGASARKHYHAAKKSVVKIQSTIRGYLQRKAYLTLRQSIPMILKALCGRISRDILFTKKIQADRDAELDAMEKKKQEEDLAKRLAEEEAERQRLIEEEKWRQALLENPGFKIIGLRQEYAATGVTKPIPPEGEIQYSFQKYAAAYFRANQTIASSEELVVGGLLGKLNEEEISRANALQIALRAFVKASSFSEEKQVVNQIADLCRASQRLIDELYANLIKLTYHNINVTNTLRGWYLISLALGFLSPSEEIEKYLANYIIFRGPEGYASHCLSLLKRAKVNGARSTTPCSLEFTSARAKASIPVTFFYPRNETISLNVDPTTIASEICLQIGNSLKLTSLSGFSISVNGQFLGEKEFLMDFFSKSGEGGINITSMDLCFQKQLYMPEEPRSTAQNALVYKQVEDSFLKEVAPVSEKDALTFSVYSYLASGGKREGLDSLEMDKLLPQALLSQKPVKEWQSLFKATFETVLQEVKDIDLPSIHSKAIGLAESLPLFFGRLFPVKQLVGPSILNAPFFLLVNINGVFAVKLEQSKRKLLTELHFNDISDIAIEGSTTLILTLSPNVYKFEMEQPGLFRDLVLTLMIELKSRATCFVALEAHKVSDPLLLNFSKGSVIRVIQSDELGTGWSKGECNDEVGMFPLQFVEGLVAKEPPRTKEALNFQVGLSSSEKAKAKPVSSKWISPQSASSPLQSSQLAEPNKPPTLPRSQTTHSQLYQASKSPAQPNEPRISFVHNAVEDPRFHFIEFAKKYFVSQKRSKGSFSKSTISRLTKKDRKASMFAEPDEEISLFEISFSPDPLKQPLLQALEGKKNIKMASSLSQNIMRCMGDYPSKKDWREHASAIIDEGIQCEEIRDELFCQIMKQLTNNGRVVSLERGWWLLNLCTGSFPPSESLAPYLKNFFVKYSSIKDMFYAEVALNCAIKLERTAINGSRQYAPIALEFDSLVTKRPIVIKVYFPDLSSRSFHLDSAMTANELLRRVHRKLDSDQGQWTGCAIYITTEAFEMSIPPKAYIFDAISEAGVQHSSYRLVFKKKLWLGKEDISSDALNNIIYHQTLPLYLRGLLVCPVIDSEEKFQEVAFLAALQYKASEDDQRKNQNFGELFRNYIPDHLVDNKSRDEWTETVLSAYTSLLNGKSQADAKAMFIDAVRKWPFYGSSFFQVKQSFDSAIPETLIMAVNLKGISILDIHSKNTLLFFKIGEIASWTYGPKHFSMKIHDLQSGDKFIFHTPSGEEITDLLEDYISHLLEQKKRGKKK